MKQTKLEKLFVEHSTDKLSWTGDCHDCKQEVTVNADQLDKGVRIEGGAIYEPEDKIFLKCPKCFAEDNVLRNFRETEVFSRVVGYMRPVSSWNRAKQEEFGLRKKYKVSK